MDVFTMGFFRLINMEGKVIMKALIKYAKGREGVEIRDIPKPHPGKGELLVKIIQAGICATDLHILLDDAPLKIEMPVAIGHEFIGEIVELGNEVSNFCTGDRVVALSAAKHCGRCSYCVSGNPILCEERKSLGSGVNGTMAEYMVFPASIAYKLPDKIANDERMILLEPMACCANAVYDISSVKSGDVVLVTGPGTIGLLTISLLKEMGAYIVASGLPSDKDRLQHARKIGADETAFSGDDLWSVLKKFGRGVDHVFECSGTEDAFNSAVKALRPKGEIIQLGIYSTGFTFNINNLTMGQLALKTSFSSSHSSWQRVIKLSDQGLFDRNDIGSIVTNRMPLEQWEIAFDKAVKREGLKMVLIP
jgi:L-iditol 2-dehydrogenase